MVLSLCACGGESSSGVPDGQIDADEDTIVNGKGATILSQLMKNINIDLLGREVSHNYNEASHIDNAVIHYTFDTWLGEVEVIRPCSYQYSRDSDLWKLIGVEKNQAVFARFSDATIDMLNSMVGRSFDVENSNDSSGAATIESVDTSGYPIKVNVSYDFDIHVPPKKVDVSRLYEQQGTVENLKGQGTIEVEITERYDLSNPVEIWGAISCDGSTSTDAQLHFRIESMDTCKFSVLR